MTFTFKLVQTDGKPVDPLSIRSAVPDMRPGDTIPTPAGQDAPRQRRSGRRAVLKNEGLGSPSY